VVGRDVTTDIIVGEGGVEGRQVATYDEVEKDAACVVTPLCKNKNFPLLVLCLFMFI
jgi:hypothetical protein